jgi:hypothetical protein
VSTAIAPLLVGSRVVSKVAHRGVPEGTEGKVIVIQGLSWIRYWVWFDNGVRLGTIDRKKLATIEEWERRNDVAVVKSVSGVAIEAGAAEGDSSGDVGGVPGYLLERSKAARARMAAKKG